MRLITNPKDGTELTIVIDQYYEDSMLIRDVNGNSILRLQVNENENLELVVIDMNRDKHTIEIRGMSS